MAATSAILLLQRNAKQAYLGDRNVSLVGKCRRSSANTLLMACWKPRILSFDSINKTIEQRRTKSHLPWRNQDRPSQAPRSTQYRKCLQPELLSDRLIDYKGGKLRHLTSDRPDAHGFSQRLELTDLPAKKWPLMLESRIAFWPIMRHISRVFILLDQRLGASEDTRGCPRMLKDLFETSRARRISNDYVRGLPEASRSIL